MGTQRDQREFWYTHWQRCQRQGMSLKKYAEQEDLTLAVFYGWSKRFKREAKTSSPFSRVAVRAEKPVEYRLHFPSGLVLEWNGEADTGYLSCLVKQLG